MPREVRGHYLQVGFGVEEVEKASEDECHRGHPTGRAPDSASVLNESKLRVYRGGVNGSPDMRMRLDLTFLRKAILGSYSRLARRGE